MATKTIENAKSVAELLDVEPDSNPPSEGDLQYLRADLEADLATITADWDDRPSGPLRITKARLRSTGICHAQVLAEAEPFVLDTDVACGAVCDLAAGLVVTHPSVEVENGWFGYLKGVLAQERPDIVALVEELNDDEREVFFATVDERCHVLRTLIGDVRRSQPTIRERARLLFDEAGVLLSAETDLVVRGKHPAIIEVKSGKLGPWILDELRFYALVRALRDLKAPSFLCSISLADRNLGAAHLRLEDLFAAARSVVATAEALVSIDRSVGDGRPVQTSPGAHCRWCRRVRLCPDVSDSVLSELPPVTIAEGVFDDEY